MTGQARDPQLDPAQSAVLVIDMQNLCAARGMGDDAGGKAPADDYYHCRLERTVVPNIRRLLAAARGRGIEVVYTVIESLTLDGRDRSLDHKLTGFNVPKGSSEGQVIAALAPEGDEIVLPKTASGVFNATVIDYVLRNLGVTRLVIVGVYTNQCVESAVRDAADRGYLVTLVEDGCATTSQASHDASLKVMAGYARIASTEEVLAEIARRERAA
jgi:ureidoacrylate peracid hydrolase